MYSAVNPYFVPSAFSLSTLNTLAISEANTPILNECHPFIYGVVPSFTKIFSSLPSAHSLRLLNQYSALAKPGLGIKLKTIPYLSLSVASRVKVSSALSVVPSFESSTVSNSPFVSFPFLITAFLSESETHSLFFFQSVPLAIT